MKKIIALIIVLFIVTSAFAQTEPVVGFWLSVDENTNKVTAAWRIIVLTSGELRGSIVSTPDEPRGTLLYNCRDRYNGFPIQGSVKQMRLDGTPLIFGLTKRDTGDWRGGNIIDPESGTMYGCRIIFHAAGSKSGNRTFQQDTLEMRGNFGPIARSQFWRRTTEQHAGSLWP